MQRTCGSVSATYGWLQDALSRGLEVQVRREWFCPPSRNIGQEKDKAMGSQASPPSCVEPCSLALLSLFPLWEVG